MQIGQYQLHAPYFFAERATSEAEVLGASVWLWMHSPLHRDAPLHTLPTLLLPIIKQQQYLLVSHQQKPILFFSWAWFNLAAEQRYLTQDAIDQPIDDWNCGDRLWISDLIAPFGHINAMKKIIVDDLFAHCCFRALYHRGQQKGTRVINFHGRHVTKEQAVNWRKNHPLAVKLPQSPPIALT